MLLDTNKLKKEVELLKEEHKNFPDTEMYLADFSTDPDEIYSKEYKELCDRILAIDAIIYNAERLDVLKARERAAAETVEIEKPVARMRIRKSITGKLHISGGASAANCSSGNRGMNFCGRVSAENAASFPAEMFCKKCFGADPHGSVRRMVKSGYIA